MFFYRGFSGITVTYRILDVFDSSMTLFTVTLVLCFKTPSVKCFLFLRDFYTCICCNMKSKTLFVIYFIFYTIRKISSERGYFHSYIDISLPLSLMKVLSIFFAVFSSIFLFLTSLIISLK